MARGMAAAVFLISLILAITMLSGIGYYAEIGTDMDVSGQNDDVQRAADNLDSIEYDEDRNSAILQGPLAVVIPAIEILQTLTTVVLNTSGVLQLLFGVPAVVGDTIQLFMQVTLVITIAYTIRGAPI